MSVGISMVFTDKGVEKAFKRLVKAAGDPRQVLGRLGLYMRRDAQRELRRRPKDWGPSSGRLSKSLAMLLEPFSVTVGSPLVYAAIQHEGGIVRPKKVYLALPVDRQIRRRGVWPRDMPEDSLKFVRAATIRIGSHSWIGPALVRASDQEVPTSAEGAGAKDGSRKKRRRVRPAGEVLFALVKQVKIKGRPYLKFDDNTKQFLFGEIERVIRRAWKGR